MTTLARLEQDLTRIQDLIDGPFKRAADISARERIVQRITTHKKYLAELEKAENE